MTTVILFFALHTIVAVILISVAGIYHAEINNYVSLTHEDINSVPSVAIGVGIIYILFLIGSCLIQRMCNREGYVMMCVLFLMILLGSSIHGTLKMTDKSGILKKSLDHDMKENFMKYNSTNNTVYIEDLMKIQHKLKCCGLYSSDDYNINLLPISCCPEPQLNINETICLDKTKRYTDGCLLKVYDIIMNDTTIVAFVSIGLTILQMIGTLYITLYLTGMETSCMHQIRNYENF